MNPSFIFEIAASGILLPILLFSSLLWLPVQPGCWERRLCCAGRNLSCSSWEHADTAEHGSWHLHIDPNAKLAKGYRLDEFFQSLFQRQHIEPYDESTPDPAYNEEYLPLSLHIEGSMEEHEDDDERYPRRQKDAGAIDDDHGSRILSVDVRKRPDGKWLLSKPFKHTKKNGSAEAVEGSGNTDRSESGEHKAHESKALRLNFDEAGKFKSVEELYDTDDDQQLFGDPFDSKEATTAAMGSGPTTNILPEAQTLLDPVIRYIVVNDHEMVLPAVLSEGDEATSAAQRVGLIRQPPEAGKSKLCYCDEICQTLTDCCQDYVTVCPVTDCQMSSWGSWSECRVTIEGDACGYGVSKRHRQILQHPVHGGKACGHIEEQHSCFKVSAPCSELTSEVALLLPYQFGPARKPGYKNNVYYDIPKAVTAFNALENYCVILEVKYLNPACSDSTLRHQLSVGSRICVECQPTAQMLKKRCVGEGVVGKETFWNALSVKHCTGHWERVEMMRNCRCNDSEKKYTALPAFLFV